MPPPTQTVPSASWVTCTRPRVLAGDVGRRHPSGAQQPLGDRGVQAPGHRVLVHSAVLVRERAELGRAVGVQADDADLEIVVARADGEDRLGVGQQRGDPARAVVGPLRVDDLLAPDAEHRRDAVQRLVVDRPAAQQRGRGEREPALDAADRDEPGAALLHDALGRLAAARLEPRVAAAERRVARERELLRRGEDPHAVVRLRRLGLHDERRLGQVRPVREALHRLRRDAVGAEHDRHRVAGVGLLGEDVDLLERAHQESPPRALMNRAVPASRSASAGIASTGGVWPSANAAISAAPGTVNSVASETSVGLSERRTRLKVVWPTSWPATISATICTQSSVE